MITRARPSAYRVVTLVAAVAMCVALLPAVRAAGQTAPTAQDNRAGGFLFVKTLDQAVCQTTYSGGLVTTHYMRGECIRLDFSVSNTDASSAVTVEVVGPAGTTVGPFTASHLGGTDWRMVERSGADWPAGELAARVLVDGTGVGEGTFFHNVLSATVSTDQPSYAPGDDITVSGTIVQVSEWTEPPPPSEAAAATATLRLLAPDGRTALAEAPVTADSSGAFSHTFPGSATSAVDPGPDTDFQLNLGVAVADASHTEPTPGVPGSGAWYATQAGSGAAKIVGKPGELILDNRFVSSTGWVKPGERYPFRVFVRNLTDQAHTGAQVTIPAPDGVTFLDAVTLRDADSASVADGSITWSLADLPAASVNEDGDLVATVATLVVEAEADSTDDDPRIVWKDLSSTASLTYTGAAGTITSEAHGPKVIPPLGGFETARYGDKPFPMVAAEYTDRAHVPGNTNEKLDRVVNDPNFPGSTFNLYREMSYGQLFPEGTVPSLGLASADFGSYDDPDFDGWHFSERDETRDCRGHTWGDGGSAFVGTGLYNQRIRDGWYQLPGNTEYYGGDYPAFTLGVGSSIDSACGPLGKAVYDSAHIADPEIDYNQYDSDKDGVVDFFMLVFVGCGGNGASQVPALCPYDDEPYDNIWPHSSTLEMQFKDADTGLRGYISDDQLTDLEGAPQCWTSEQRLQSDTCASHGGSGDDSLPVYVRVGPYNVNPETALDSASVISHEYGHHLGLPDYYRAGHDYYADWNLMAADYSQHMTVFSKQDLGWVVPEPLQPGDEVTVERWTEIKQDTGEIHWVDPDGNPYTLSAANGDQNIHNGLAYAAKLPQRQILDPEKVEEQASPVHVWWSGRGNDFGCPPSKGHNLDIYVPELADVADDTTVTLTFKSSWDIEWDWDYGFLFTSPDGANYTSQPSENGYTTDNSYNPNNQQCFEEHNNGLTGTSGSYQDGTQTVDRNPAAPDYSKGSPFLADEYDVSELAGAESPVVRFSYFTDAAFDRPGWFIDDIEITAGDEVIYSSDFEQDEEGRVFSGGCDPDGIDVAVKCTPGWNKIRSDAAAPFDHAYYLELRDQSGFDYDGHDQSDRGDTAWSPGLLVEYTDEAHGYGNNGVAFPPAQHYLDSQPQPGSECPVENCSDASFTDANGDDVFSDAVTEERPGGWIDNFQDPDNSYEDDFWHFDYGCLTAEVVSMAGDGIGPDPTTLGPDDPLSDLWAYAQLSAGAGCRTFQYEYPQSESQSVEVRRVAGEDRIRTSIAVANEHYDSSDLVVLARADEYADALAGAPFAASRNAPILLNPRGHLHADVRQAIRDLGASRVRLLGGVAALSDQVEADLEGMGLEVQRFAGVDRYDTARLIAGQLDGEHVYLVEGDDPDEARGWPDAMVAAAVAAFERRPVLLAVTEQVPGPTSTALEQLGTDHVTLVGGSVALSDGVERDLRDRGLKVEREAGADRYATSATMARRGQALGMDPAETWLARGDDWPDSLSAGPIVGTTGGSLLLVHRNGLDGSPATRDHLVEHLDQLRLIRLLGGEVALTPVLEQDVRSLVGAP